MGSGVSTEIVSLVGTVRSDKGTKRIDALQKLFSKSDIVEYKLPMSTVG